MTSERYNDTSTLGWVRKELEETLQQSAQALEEYAEDRSDRTQLRFCMTYLHQVYGTLQMLELYGLSMLVEEMEHVLDGLVNGDLAQPGEGEETLMRGILSVSDYLERIQQGEQDSGLLVLPLLNDLRAARGEPLLTESTLFAPNLDAAQPRPRHERSEASIAGLARQHRHLYQRALLAYLRGQAVERSLERMQTVLDQLDAAAGDDRTGDLWWIAAGVVDGLRNGDLEATAAVKSLLGQVDRQLKQVIDHGEQVLAESPPRDLLKNMLYYVGQSGASTERLGAIQERFSLGALLPDAGERARNQENGGYRPGSDILRSVSDALREDITAIKDALDLYVRSEQQEPERLGGVGDMLRRVADTLGMLGLGVPRRVVREQVERVERLAGGGAADEQELMDFARALLYVESALEGLTETNEPSVGEAGTMELGEETVALQDDDLFDLEYRAVYQTAIREAVADIGTIKEALVALMEQRGEEPLAGMETLLRRLQGALEMLDLQRAGGLLEAAGRCIREEVMASPELPAEERMDALADAITSLEYYLEAVLENRSGRETILDVAENSVRVLGYDGETPAEDRASTADADGNSTSETGDGDVAADDASRDAEAREPDAETGSAEDGHGGEASPAPAAAEGTPAPAAPGRTGASGGVDLQVPVAADELDPEILEIFLEEVDECLETIHDAYPRWRANPEEQEPLITVRRMFHTLKGSGRLAGALLLGELAWSVERLLNRIIDGHVTPVSDVFTLMDDTLAAIPQLVRELQGGEPPVADVRGLMREAVRLADGQPAPDPEPPPEPDQDPSEASGAGAADDHGDAATEASGGEPPEASVDSVLPTADMEGTTEPGAVPETAEEEIPDEAAVAESDTGAEAADLGPAPVGAPEEDADDDDGERSWRGETAQDEDEAGAPSPGMDPTLYEIFRNETDDHLRTVHAFLAHAEASGDGTVTDDLLRGLHTLSGSARMADVQAVAALARDLELLAASRRDEDRPLEARERDVVARGAEQLEAMVQALGEGTALPDADGLHGEIAELAELGDSAPDTTSGGAEPDAPEDTAADRGAGEASQEAEIDPDLVELFLEEADDILRFMDETMERLEDDPAHEGALAEMQRSLHTLKGGARLARFDGVAGVCHALEQRVADLEHGQLAADDEVLAAVRDGYDQLQGMVALAREQGDSGDAAATVERLQALRPESGHPAPAAAEADPPEEGDSELREVFVDEAAELLQNIEAAQQAWVDAPEETDRIHDLERALHTLKGGARMAGYTPVANLSHALESLLVQLRDAGTVPDAGLFELLERCHDRLHLMREHAVQGQRLAEAEDLLAALRQWQQGEAPGAPDTGDTDSAPAERPADGAAGDQPGAAASETASPSGGDQIRVRADLLDNLVNYAGEVSIYRARLDQQVGAFRFNLTELDQTVQRLRDQLRTLEIETEAQILYRHERAAEDGGVSAADAPDGDEQFDPLELDRYSRMQELSRGLGESVNDLASIESLLDNLARESETLLLQQSRVNTELQDGLMRTRMVPFASLVPRLRRVVRQTAAELGREARIRVHGAQGEMDRTVLDRIVAPLEHMLRNAVAHGIETPEQRRAAGKPDAGQIELTLDREGADIVLRVSDDGSGMDLDAIRRKARERGLLRDEREPTDREVMQFVMEQGFSTAHEVTQVAGRGVGMDVVNAEIKQLGGSLDIDSERGRGTRFVVRLPFTLAMNQALLCTAGDQAYAIPLTSIDGVVRITRDQMETYLAREDEALYHYAGQDYEITSLSVILGEGEPNLAGQGTRVPLVLLQSGDHRLALQVDGLIGSREIVVKSVGPQISNVPGIYGATILADGRVVFILEMSALMRQGVAEAAPGDEALPAAAADEDAEQAQPEPLVMVVDDSITMRKVASRLLERNHMQVITANDGVDAVAKLQEHVPDAMLLDIEMPRMDGYELATHMRNDERLQHVPIIMITSRTGEKHRARALDIGVDRYLGKPYQESELLGNLDEVLTQGHGGH
ncbi:Hpt domain-containing protein [Aquisalimonas lutea]|uniref:Hpt domain-containing protein n=1 Tax=Aquisalimonas lutea TaxID=1327750 RepID=UPI0025B3C550|nr:Hpt domain-containing protein [Aquisalimonas lutea]MDN3516099.1 Hpt domain-containing protein [Aquisalimonas lutea]